jgi:Protein of unknown function (DUF2919)
MKKDGSASQRRYSVDSYDDNLCLKPPFLLWVMLLFLSRGVALPLALGLAAYSGMQDTKGAFAGALDVQTLLPSAFAALVLFAAIRRKPAARGLVRWIWAHGRTLLVLSAILDFVLALADSPIRHGDFNDRAGLPLLTATFDLYFLVYVLIARQARDAFADFPAAMDSPPKSQSA